MLHVAHDESPRQIEICNDDYKFDAFLHNILQEFAVVKKVICIFHSEIVRTLHNHRTYSYRDLRRNDFITNELEIPWDHDISSMFSRKDLVCPACHFNSVITYNELVREASFTFTTLVQIGCMHASSTTTDRV